jgi:hypothetical protein
VILLTVTWTEGQVVGAGFACVVSLLVGIFCGAVGGYNLGKAEILERLLPPKEEKK